MCFANSKQVFFKIQSGGRRIEMCSIVNQSTARKSDQSDVTISGRLANQKPGKKNQSERRIQKKRFHWYSLNSMKSRDKRAETHTSFDMSRRSKSKDQTKALNIPFTLTQRDLLQEALAVKFAKDQTQAFEHSGQSTPRRWKIGRTHRMEWQQESGSAIFENRYDSYQSRCQLIITTVESLVQCFASGERFDQLSERRRTRRLEIWPRRRRLCHHQSPSTENSHQEVLRD